MTPAAMRLVPIALALLLAHAAPAQDDRPEPEHLRAHVEQIRDDPAFGLLGVPIASKRLIPELYARRGFTRIWTTPSALPLTRPRRGIVSPT